MRRSPSWRCRSRAHSAARCPARERGCRHGDRYRRRGRARRLGEPPWGVTSAPAAFRRTTWSWRPRNWQGLQRPIMIAKHPLSGHARLDRFALEPGRWRVMLTRHQSPCVIVGHDGIQGGRLQAPPARLRRACTRGRGCGIDGLARARTSSGRPHRRWPRASSRRLTVRMVCGRTTRRRRRPTRPLPRGTRQSPAGRVLRRLIRRRGSGTWPIGPRPSR